jgi:hypothetical protein
VNKKSWKKEENEREGRSTRQGRKVKKKVMA